MSQNVERELGWDDEIQKDGGEFTVLPAGITISRLQSLSVVDFQVAKRCRHAIRQSWN